MLTAMLMHGIWDASAALAGMSVFGWIVPTAVASVLIAVFVWIYPNTEPIERHWMRELMAPEVELGVVTSAELDAISDTRSNLRRYISEQASPARPRTCSTPNRVSHGKPHATAAPRLQVCSRLAPPSQRPGASEVS